jgi:anti-sigma B factor antagonist
MKIDFNKNIDVLSIALDGRLDTVTAPELDSFIGENYDGTGSIVIDCKKLAYISSAGLRVLLSAHKKTKGALKLVNVCELVMEVFEMTGFAEILVIE